MAEDGWHSVKSKLDASHRVFISAATVAELILVLIAKGRPNARLLTADLLKEAEIEVVPFEEAQLTWFTLGIQRYGKGRHKAALNFGDCFSYALAKSTGMPLLFVGDDFARTDLVPA